MFKSNKLTYGSKRNESGIIEHKDILRSVPGKNTLFDALYSSNIKKYKKDNSYLMPNALSGIRKQAVTKKSKKVIKPQVFKPPPSESSSDSSLHVKHNSYDLFDQIKNTSNCSNNSFQKLLNGEENKPTSILIHSRINLTSDSSTYSPAKSDIGNRQSTELGLNRSRKKKSIFKKKKAKNIVDIISKAKNTDSITEHNFKIEPKNNEKSEILHALHDSDLDIYKKITQNKTDVLENNKENFSEISNVDDKHPFLSSDVWKRTLKKSLLKGNILLSSTPCKSAIPFCVQDKDLSAILLSNSDKSFQNNLKSPLSDRNNSFKDCKINSFSEIKNISQSFCNYNENTSLESSNSDESIDPKLLMIPIVELERINVLPKSIQDSFVSSLSDESDNSNFIGFPSESDGGKPEYPFLGFDSQELSRKCSPNIFDSCSDFSCTEKNNYKTCDTEKKSTAVNDRSICKEIIKNKLNSSPNTSNEPMTNIKYSRDKDSSLEKSLSNDENKHISQSFYSQHNGEHEYNLLQEESEKNNKRVQNENINIIQNKLLLSLKKEERFHYDSSDSQQADISSASTDSNLKHDYLGLSSPKSLKENIIVSPIRLRNKKTISRLITNMKQKKLKKHLKKKVPTTTEFDYMQCNLNSPSTSTPEKCDKNINYGIQSPIEPNHIESADLNSTWNNSLLDKTYDAFVTKRRTNTVLQNIHDISNLSINTSVLQNEKNNDEMNVYSFKSIDSSTIIPIEEIERKKSSGNCGSLDIAKNFNQSNLTLSETLDSVNTRPRLTLIDTLNSPKFKHRPSIVLEPGKRWERSLNILRHLNQSNLTLNDTLDSLNSTLQPSKNIKGRKYRQSVAHLLDLQPSDGHRNSCFDLKQNVDNTLSSTKRCSFTIIEESTLQSEDISLNNSHLKDRLLTDTCNDTEVNLSRLAISEVGHNKGLLDKDSSEPNWTDLSARDVVLRRCNQTHPLPFDECYPEKKLRNCCKIGEGVYGEVFLYKNQDDPTNPIVMKVIPIEGTQLVNGDHQKKFEEIISEIVIAMELSDLRNNEENCTFGFNQVNRVRCVKGRYPARLVELWELYDESKGSENDCPTIFDVGQLYIVLELANGGKDLEAFNFTDAEQAYYLFFQIVFALAVAEEAFQFEHRDLHWGNVLITLADETRQKYTLRGESYLVPSGGVRANIIDFTLSRITLPGAGHTIFNNLAKDPDLFDAEGDYQFDIYRLMREKNGDLWHRFEPYTNILWLHYILSKMITALRYERTVTVTHILFISKLQELKEKILQYDSCVDFVTNEACFTISNI